MDDPAPSVSVSCEPDVRTVAIDSAACELPTVPGAFDLELGWTVPWPAPVSFSPVRVGLLVDHDGNGVVEPADGAELVIVADNWDGTGVEGLYYVDAVTGVVDVAIPGSFGYWSAIADVNGDGRSEVIILTDDRATMSALDGEGNPVWVTELPYYGADTTMISVADMDGDGAVEVVTSVAILDGASGAVEHTIEERYIQMEFMPIDLDLDGVSEILTDAWVLRADGSLAWEADWKSYPGVSMPVQADEDSAWEVLYHDAADSTGGPDRFFLYDSDGSELPIDLPDTLDSDPSQGCSGDFDGDGEWEYGLVVEDTFVLLDDDLSISWTSGQPMGRSSCTGFDLDGDGDDEILIGGESEFSIFDHEGNVLFSAPTVDGGNLSRLQPFVVDLDADGHAEIVMPDAEGVQIYRQVDGQARPAGVTWPIQDFAVGRVADDGAVALPPFGDTAGLHSYPPAEPTTAWDLALDAVGACTSACAVGAVALQVSNASTVASPPVTVELVSSGGVVSSQAVAPLEPGTSVVVTFELTDPALLSEALTARLASQEGSCAPTDEVVLPPPC